MLRSAGKTYSPVGQNAVFGELDTGLFQPGHLAGVEILLDGGVAVGGGELKVFGEGNPVPQHDEFFFGE